LGKSTKLKKFEFGNPYMTKDLAHIIFKLVLLKKIAAGEVYSYSLIKDFSNPKMSHFLKKYGSNVKNTIYNTVNALEKSGYIKEKSRIESGRLKKFYYITSSGKIALRESKVLFFRSMKELKNIVG